MAGPLVTCTVHISFILFVWYTGCIFFSSLVKPMFPYEMSFYQNPVTYCNIWQCIAIHSKTLRNTSALVVILLDYKVMYINPIQ